jgi:hypothetical protein
MDALDAFGAFGLSHDDLEQLVAQLHRDPTRPTRRDAALAMHAP